MFTCGENKQILSYILRHEDMATVSSVNAFHPTKHIIAGGNASGKVYVWCWSLCKRQEEKQKGFEITEKPLWWRYICLLYFKPKTVLQNIAVILPFGTADRLFEQSRSFFSWSSKPAASYSATGNSKLSGFWRGKWLIIQVCPSRSWGHLPK